ncbi:hypothetical protein [Bacillus sp. BHET2]|uniref:hypothetical protein n=1 Tax=Bacillus sp. BHET2 TaxID=2583818 RepID=UPI00148601AF|nr:hypothetical protein [Bacillus sp. BHET2]
MQHYMEPIQFYSNIIGMKEETHGEKETMFTINGRNFFIENSEHNTVYFEFAVDDFERSKKKLLDSGCKVDHIYHERSEMISDPFGLKFHLYEVGKTK